MMLEEHEKKFIEHWEKHRERESDLMFQLLSGLPIGLLFSVPILLVMFSGRWWFKRADIVANSHLSPWVLAIAVFIIAIFVAVLYKRHQWDMKEQQYHELKRKGGK
jgi:membrane protein YdbS with pleckstrin-like domain